VADDGPTTAANAQGLTLNSHVLKDHPGIHVTAAAIADQQPDDPVDDPVDGDVTDDVTGAGSAAELRLAELRANSPDGIWTMPTGHSYRCPPPPALGHGARPCDVAVPPPRPPPLADTDLHATATRIIAQARARRRRSAKRDRHRIRRLNRLAARDHERARRRALIRAYKRGTMDAHTVGRTVAELATPEGTGQ
ncbi:MAG: hypothetical protein ACR2GM_09045, partial [Nocardioidaceae bacterium]